MGNPAEGVTTGNEILDLVVEDQSESADRFRCKEALNLK